MISLYSIKQIADLVGVTPKALRLYEKKNLLMPIARTDAGYRMYDDTSVRRLEKICKLKRYHFTLNEISELLDASDDVLDQKLVLQRRKLTLEACQYNLLVSNFDTMKTKPRQQQNSALIIVNMQNDFIYGRLGFSAGRSMISSVTQFIEYAHTVKLPVVYLCDNHTDKDVYEFKLWGKHALEGSAGAEICDDLHPAPNDIYIHKRSYSGFFHTDLLMVLNSLQINDLIVLGVSSDICVYHTIADAFNYHYTTTLLTDLTAASRKTDFSSSLVLMQNNFNVAIKQSANIYLQ